MASLHANSSLLQRLGGAPYILLRHGADGNSLSYFRRLDLFLAVGQSGWLVLPSNTADPLFWLSCRLQRGCYCCRYSRHRGCSEKCSSRTSHATQATHKLSYSENYGIISDNIMVTVPLHFSVLPSRYIASPSQRLSCPSFADLSSNT